MVEILAYFGILTLAVFGIGLALYRAKNKK